MKASVSPADVAARPFLVSRRTRNRVSDIDRARLVWWYVTAALGGDRNPARTLADRYPESSYKTWANVLSQARTREPALLTDPPRRGVAGGDLTEHAEQLLGLDTTIPAAVKDEYEAEREVYAAPVRRERRTASPGRSKFASDDEYGRAFDRWVERGEWYLEIDVGPETYEDYEDWWTRMIEMGLASNGEGGGSETFEHSGDDADLGPIYSPQTPDECGE